MDLVSKLSEKIGSSKYFTWGEALYLRSWAIYVFPDNPSVISEVEKTALKMDQIREIFDKPIKVTSWIRPISYNTHIVGAKNSHHIYGRACDFIVHGVESEDARTILKPFLVSLNIRMENYPNASWVHIDTACVPETPIERRFFKP